MAAPGSPAVSRRAERAFFGGMAALIAATAIELELPMLTSGSAVGRGIVASLVWKHPRPSIFEPN